MTPLGLWIRLSVLATAGLIALGPFACCCVRSAALGRICCAHPALAENAPAACCSACSRDTETAAGDEVAVACSPARENCRCKQCALSVSSGPILPAAARDLDLPGNPWVLFVPWADRPRPAAPILPVIVRRERSLTLPVATGREWLAWACILRC